jgi:ABC-2 type transport system ATP-binding protein
MIILKNINKSYGAKKILEDISAEFKLGEIVAVAGKNGSGKTAVLKIITGADNRYKGEKTISSVSLGYAPQENALFEDVSVKDNIYFFCAAQNAAFNCFDLPKDVLKKKVKNLSGGMKRRVNILVALINDPDFLILDEPTANLDIVYQRLIFDIIIERKKRGKSAIFTSHSEKEIKSADRVYVMEGGKFVFEGPGCDFDDAMIKN